MNILRLAVLGTLLVIVLSVVALVVLGYGWVPSVSEAPTKDYFGERPRSLVAWYGSGWTDHKIFFIFKADPTFVRRAAKFGSLVRQGDMSRDDCLAAFNPPWWFDLTPHTQGMCWARREGYAGNIKMHYAPASGLVYVFDYST